MKYYGFKLYIIDVLHVSYRVFFKKGIILKIRNLDYI